MVVINRLEEIIMNEFKMNRETHIKLKQQSILKRKDLDLKLYLDFQKELVEYRNCLFVNTNMKIIELNKLRDIHNKILERLAKRLKIQTIFFNLENSIKKIVKEKY